MSTSNLARCRQHRTAPVSPDCAMCSVRELAICAPLNEEASRLLESQAASLQLPAGGVLARAGQASRHAYTVTSGMLRLSRTLADGRRQVTEFMIPGDFVGISGSAVHRHDIEAVAASTVCIFEREQIQSLSAQYPELERTLFERACGEIESAHDTMLLLARMSPLERLCSFLLRIRKRAARGGNPKDTIALPMGRGDIADHLGLTVETVSRSFTRLREMGLISLPDPQRVEILDADGMAKLANITV